MKCGRITRLPGDPGLERGGLMGALVGGYQMRTKMCDNPVALAISGLYQRVAFRGASCSAWAVTLPTRLSLTVRGAPGHASPRRLAKCGRQMRARHWPTVRAVTRGCRTTISWMRSSWQAGAMRVRSANACEVPLHQFE